MRLRMLLAPARHLQNSRTNLPRAEDGHVGRSGSTRALGESSPMRRDNTSPRARRNRRSIHADSPTRTGMGNENSHLSEASTAASTDCTAGGASPAASPPPRRDRPPQPPAASSTASGPFALDSSQRSVRWGGDSPARPPAPMGLSTALSRGAGDATWNFETGSGEEGSSHHKSMKRMGSQLGDRKSVV